MKNMKDLLKDKLAVSLSKGFDDFFEEWPPGCERKVFQPERPIKEDCQDEE